MPGRQYHFRRAVQQLGGRIPGVDQRSTCPLCLKTMKPSHGGRQHRDAATKAHVFSGRDPRRGAFPLYFIACSGCNTDQGQLALNAWAERLASKNDPRAARARDVWDTFVHHTRFPTEDDTHEPAVLSPPSP